MNVVLLTLLSLTGTGGEVHIAPVDEGMSAEGPERVGRHGRHLHGTTLHGHCLGPMPQTCYDPPYGCYHGSRWSNRYPAFHGTYYRKAYNYRNYFDYPWHAEMHEPTSHWSHHVTGDTGEPSPLPANAAPSVEQAPPAPVPTQASLELPLMDEVRSVLTKRNNAELPANPARTLRR